MLSCCMSHVKCSLWLLQLTHNEMIYSYNIYIFFNAPSVQFLRFLNIRKVKHKIGEWFKVFRNINMSTFVLFCFF